MKWRSACLLLLLAGCSRPSAPSGPDEGVTVEAITFPAGSERGMGKLFRPAGPAPFPAVVVVHNDSGLTPRIEEEARSLADKGYLVLAVDLYRGVKVKEDVEEAHIMDRAMPEERVLGDLRGAVTFLAGREDVRAGAIGILGWGTGGGYALDAAVADKRIKAVVTCYGRLRTTPEALRGLEAPVLGIFAGQDVGISAETIQQFKGAMRQAGKRPAVAVIYPESDHGFLDTAGPQNKDYVAAWKWIDAFLTAELRQR